MKNIFGMTFGVASVLLASFISLSALAAEEDWDRLGAIEVSHRPGEYVQNFDVSALHAYRRISFRSRVHNVRCDLIRIRFMNGESQEINHDRFPRDERRTFDLYGSDRRISHIHFECTPGAQASRARLVIFGRD